jgi:hypothetical protein
MLKVLTPRGLRILARTAGPVPFRAWGRLHSQWSDTFNALTPRSPWLFAGPRSRCGASPPPPEPQLGAEARPRGSGPGTPVPPPEHCSRRTSSPPRAIKATIPVSSSATVTSHSFRITFVMNRLFSSIVCNMGRKVSRRNEAQWTFVIASASLEVAGRSVKRMVVSDHLAMW